MIMTEVNEELQPDDDASFTEKLDEMLEDLTASKDYGGELDDEELEALQEKVHDHEVEGWKVSEGHSDHVVMRKATFGSPAFHAILALPTLGFGNLFYGVYRYFRSLEKKVLRP